MVVSLSSWSPMGSQFSLSEMFYNVFCLIPRYNEEYMKEKKETQGEFCFLSRSFVSVGGTDWINPRRSFSWFYNVQFEFVCKAIFYELQNSERVDVGE